MGWRNVLIWGGWVAAGLPLAASAAQDTCDDEDVRFLQSHGYSPREIRLSCTAADKGRVAAADAVAARPVAVAHAVPKVALAPKVALEPVSFKTGSTSRTETSPVPMQLALATQAIPIARTPAEAKKAEAAGEPTPATAVDPLAAFTTSTSNGSTLATMHIVTAYAPVRSRAAKADDTSCGKVDSRDYLSNMALGFDISASLPAKSSTLRDYGRHALSKLDGGVLNVLGAFGVWTPGDAVYCRLQSGDGTNPRVTTYDHMYIGHPSAPDEMVPYIKHGAGVRAVKTKLEGGSMAGVGTAYLGLGFDGPLLSALNLRNDPRAGWFTIEAFGVANVVNHRTLESLFLAEGDTTRAPRSFATANARVKIDLPGRFYLSAEYAKPLGSFRGHIGDTSIVTFGYNNQSDPGAKKGGGS
jgi:hypothetical protein